MRSGRRPRRASARPARGTPSPPRSRAARPARPWPAGMCAMKSPAVRPPASHPTARLDRSSHQRPGASERRDRPAHRGPGRQSDFDPTDSAGGNRPRWPAVGGGNRGHRAIVDRRHGAAGCDPHHRPRPSRRRRDGRLSHRGEQSRQPAGDPGRGHRSVARRADLPAEQPAGRRSGRAAPAAPNPLHWTLGTLAAGESRTIELDCRVDRSGTINHCASVQTGEGLTGQDCLATTVAAAAIELHLTGPTRAVVGEEARFLLEIVNRGATAASGLTLTDRFDDGFVHAISKSPIQRDLEPLGPGDIAHDRGHVQGGATGAPLQYGRSDRTGRHSRNDAGLFGSDQRGRAAEAGVSLECHRPPDRAGRRNGPVHDRSAEHGRSEADQSARDEQFRRPVVASEKGRPGLCSKRQRTHLDHRQSRSRANGPAAGRVRLSRGRADLRSGHSDRRQRSDAPRTGLLRDSRRSRRRSWPAES